MWAVFMVSPGPRLHLAPFSPLRICPQGQPGPSLPGDQVEGSFLQGLAPPGADYPGQRSPGWVCPVVTSSHLS